MSARDDVRRLLAEGRKQAEIASLLGISAGRVSQLAKEIRAETAAQPPPAAGAKTKVARNPPPGPNKGSFTKGDERAGAPPGNTNAVTTGEYQSIWIDQLDDDEVELLGSISTDALVQTEEEIRLITIRERRMLQRIEMLRRQPMTIVEESVDEVHGPPADKGDGEETDETGLVVKKRKRSFKRLGTLGQIQAIEEALTRVQARKAELLELAHKLRTAKTPDNIDIQTYLDALKATAGDVWADEPPPPDEADAAHEDGGAE